MTNKTKDKKYIITNKTKDIREILNQYNIPWKYGNKEEVEATVKMFSKIIEQERTDKEC